MITTNRSSKIKNLAELSGLSIDEKPLYFPESPKDKLPNGSVFVEMDTGAHYKLDGSTNKWVLQPMSTGDGSGGTCDVTKTYVDTLVGDEESARELSDNMLDDKITVLSERLKSKTITQSQLDDVTTPLENGFYAIYTPVGLPTSSTGFYFVDYFKTAQGYCMQRLKALGTNIENTYERECINSSFGSWKQLATNDQITVLSNDRGYGDSKIITNPNQAIENGKYFYWGTINGSSDCGWLIEACKQPNGRIFQTAKCVYGQYDGSLLTRRSDNDYSVWGSWKQLATIRNTITLWSGGTNTIGVLNISSDITNFNELIVNIDEGGVCTHCIMIKSKSYPNPIAIGDIYGTTLTTGKLVFSIKSIREIEVKTNNGYLTNFKGVTP